MANTVEIGGMTFHVHPLNTNYKDEPGLYAFMSVSGASWQIHYIGETGSLQDRLTTNFEQHQAFYCAVKLHGSTHLATKIQSGGKQARLDLESRLRSQYQPSCNRQ